MLKCRPRTTRARATEERTREWGLAHFSGPTLTGTDNTASGFDALISNTVGISNTASGSSALASNTTAA